MQDTYSDVFFPGLVSLKGKKKVHLQFGTFKEKGATACKPDGFVTPLVSLGFALAWGRRICEKCLSNVPARTAEALRAHLAD